MAVFLRPATPGDIPLLEYWDTKDHVIAAGGDDDTQDWAVEISREENWQQLLIGEEDGRPVGVVQIIDPALEESHYWGETAPNQRAIDIWIGEEADLGRGLGTQMMLAAIDQCFKDTEVSAILIDPLESNTAAQRFYARLGFKEQGPRTFGTDTCLVMRLDREVWRTSLSLPQ